MWPASSTRREVLANLLAERWRGLIAVVLVAAAVALVTYVELTQVERAVSAQRQLTAAGADVFRATPATEGSSIEAARCAALNTNPAVFAAGGFAEDSEHVWLEKAPGERLNLRTMVGELTTVLTGSLEAVDTTLVIPATEATRLGVVDGSMLAFTDGRVHTVTVLHLETRFPDPGAWVAVRGAPHGEVTECLVQFRRGATANAQDAIRTWLTTGSGDLIVQPHLAEDELRTSPLAAFQSRPTRFAWTAGGIAVGLVVTIIVWFRRPELALYRSLGAPVSTVTLIYAGQYLSLLLVGVLSGAMIGTYFAILETPLTFLTVLGTAARQGVLVFLAASVVLVLATVAISAGKVSTYIRERL